MEGIDNTHSMLTLEEGENNPFSSFDDKQLVPSLMFSGDMGTSSCSPASFHMSSQPENFQGGRGGEPMEMGGLNDHNNKGKGKISSALQRIAFHTRSDDNVLDDGYRWRKYGQKSVKNNAHPRFFF